MVCKMRAKFLWGNNQDNNHLVRTIQILRSMAQYLPTAILITVALFVGVLSCGDVAFAFDFHADSAHGNNDPAPGYGVNRSTATCENWPGGICSIGDCAHCHDTFDDSICGVNELMLFAKTIINQGSGFCMACHRGANSAQDGGYIINFDYSRRSGSVLTKTCPATIKSAFIFINKDTHMPQMNCDSIVGSAHDLEDIVVRALKNRWGWGSNVWAINPCLGCHDPHRAKEEYPCSLPSGHADKSTWEIWGDESGEKMADYTPTFQYQPPYNATGGYERGKWLQPDYITLCLECHQEELYSSRYGRNLYAINWGIVDNPLGGNRHGNRKSDHSDHGKGKKDPYTTSLNYVLCCTDCHEPHGSRNEYLLRTEVNGTSGIEINTAGHWADFCSACHDDTGVWYDHMYVHNDECWSCHRHSDWRF